MTLKLITAVLMTLAAVAWLASALLVPAGDDSLIRWLIVATFAVMAVFYWMSYFRMKKSNTGVQ